MSSRRLLCTHGLNSLFYTWIQLKRIWFSTEKLIFKIESKTMSIFSRRQIFYTLAMNKYSNLFYSVNFIMYLIVRVINLSGSLFRVIIFGMFKKSDTSWMDVFNCLLNRVIREQLQMGKYNVLASKLSGLFDLWRNCVTEVSGKRERYVPPLC